MSHRPQLAAVGDEADTGVAVVHLLAEECGPRAERPNSIRWRTPKSSVKKSEPPPVAPPPGRAFPECRQPVRPAEEVGDGCLKRPLILLLPLGHAFSDGIGRSTFEHRVERELIAGYLCVG